MNKKLILFPAIGILLLALLLGCPLPGDPPVAAPTIDIASGTYVAAQTVTITSATTGSTIKYTIDGTDPLTGTDFIVGEVGSATAVIAVESSITLMAYAYLSGMADSAVSTAVYLITSSEPGTVVAPTIDIASGTYATAQTVGLATTTTGATIK